MGPKKNTAMEEGEELRKAIDSLTENVASMREEQKKILDLVEEVKKLRKENQEKDNKIEELEKRVDELEQYTRMNDVIVTGLRIKPRTYANTVAPSNNGGEMSEGETRSAELQVAAFLHSKGITFNADDLEACHPLPRRHSRDKPAIIIRFTSRKRKIELLKQGRQLKGTEVYLNEHLTRKNAEIAKRARQLRKQNKIQSTWIRNCKTFIKLNGSPEEARVLVVRKLSELDAYEN